jgi:spore coat protein U-like protein
MNKHLLRSLLQLLLIACAIFMPTVKAATSCSATAPTNIIFNPVSTSTFTDASVTFNVNCQTTGLGLLSNAKVRMCLNIDDGLSGGGNYNPRRMLNSFGEPLQFQLYTDAARTQVWGNGTVPPPRQLDFDYPVTLAGGQTQSVTLYGRVPTQTLIAGSYSNAFTGLETSIQFRYDEPTLIFPATFPASCTSGGDGGNSFTNAFPFTAQAQVPATCYTYVTTDLDFGSVPGLITSNHDGSSTITMTCTGRTAWNVGLNNGLNASGSVRRMRLAATANLVAYEIYREPARTSRWGNTIGTDTVPGTGTGVSQTLTVHGRVPAPQSAAPGNYSDIITVTITY